MNETTEPQPPGLRARLALTLALTNRRLFAVALLLSVAPLWFGPYLPMVDLAQHAGQVVALKELVGGNPLFTQSFEINWFTPYLIGYLLLYALSLVLPITLASKVVVSLSLVAIPVLTGSLLRAVGADERWKWLAIPGSYSVAFYWGFLSYMVAAPLGLLFLIQTVRFAREPSVRGAVLIALFSIFLFFCHVIVLGFASVLALAYLLGCHFRDPKTLVLRALPYAVPLPLIVVWLVTTHASEASVQNAPITFGPITQRLLAVLVQPAGLEHFSLLGSLVVTGTIVLLPPLAGARFTRRPERWLPFAAGLMLFLVMPSYAFNTGFLYERLGLFLVPLWLLLWERPRADEAPRLGWVAMAMVAFWVVLNVGRFAAFVRETQSFDRVVQHIEPGRRVASMIFDYRSALFAVPVYLHFPAWYQARQLGIVDFNFADFHPQWVRYKDRQASRIRESLAWYPTLFRWEANGGSQYDYFLVKSNQDVSAPIFKEKRSAVRLIAHSDWWWLYENVERTTASAER